MTAHVKVQIKTRAKNGVALSKRKVEALINQAGRENYVLRLYITGTTPRSCCAIANIRSLCEEHLAGRYDLEVIDIYQQPAEASGRQIIAVPTLIKELPLPAKRVVGDLSDRNRVLIALDLADRQTNGIKA